MKKESRILIAGYKGMVGSALLRLLKSKGFKNIILADIEDADLRNQSAVNRYMKRVQPEYVFLFSAKVGGIKANMEHPAEFLYDNLMIEANMIHACYLFGVKKLLFFGSSCIYPREARQPIKESYLLSGKLEPTNEGYALAKIAGLKLCQYYNRQFKTNFICLLPCNLYGPKDNFDINSGHVIPALIKKFCDAKTRGAGKVEIWGSGKAKREFLYVDDVAQAAFYFMQKVHAKNIPGFINTGSGRDVTIKELAGIISEATGYKGRISWNKNMPDGMPRKLLDSTLARRLGWSAEITFKNGIRRTVSWYKENRK